MFNANFVMYLFLMILGVVSVFLGEYTMACMCFIMANQMTIMQKLETIHNGI